jgi:glycosyltransferase involved in cell wall biosynthesis
MAFDPKTFQKGLVSVIIPTYNRPDMALRAVRSVLEQTYGATQLILVDDGSTDNTRQVFENYPGVEYHWQSNARQAAARNLGLSFAKGEFIAYLDSDDWWHPDYLTELVAALSRTGAGLAFSGWKYLITVKVADAPSETPLDQDKVLARFCTQREGDWYFLDPQRTRDLLVEHAPVNSSGIVLRRECHWNMWDQKLKYAEDVMLLLEIALTSKPACVFTLKPLWFKCLHDSNDLERIAASADEQRGFLQAAVRHGHYIYDKIEGKLTSHEKALVNLRIATSCFDLGYFESQQGCLSAACKAYFDSFKVCPSPKPLVAMLKAVLRSGKRAFSK